MHTRTLACYCMSMNRHELCVIMCVCECVQLAAAVRLLHGERRRETKTTATCSCAFTCLYARTLVILCCSHRNTATTGAATRTHAGAAQRWLAGWLAVVCECVIPGRCGYMVGKMRWQRRMGCVSRSVYGYSIMHACLRECVYVYVNKPLL